MIIEKYRWLGEEFEYATIEFVSTDLTEINEKYSKLGFLMTHCYHIAGIFIGQFLRRIPKSLGE